MDDAVTTGSPVSEVPPADLPVPASVRAVIGDGVTTALWRNGLGGLTFALEVAAAPEDAPAPRRIVKWSPDGAPELAREAERMRWLAARFPAPRVVAHHRVDGGEMLITDELDARSAIDPRWKDDPETAARAIATGLRRLHALPVTDCPFDWSVDTRIAAARAEGRHVPAELQTPPPLDRLVVCHGDACSPNTLLTADGRFAALVDLGWLGVADRWADLAIGSWALDWNYGSGYEEAFWSAYGVEPDADRIAYYRRLWDAT